MAQLVEAPQRERLSKRELGEVLPPSIRFKERLEMARDALSVADTAKKLLSEEVSRANAELEAAGKLGRLLSVRTPEYFRRRNEDGVEKPLTYEGDAYTAPPRLRDVSGVFEGLTVIDTQIVEYPPHKIASMRGEQPERLIICGALSDTEQADGATTYVPHEWLEGPKHAIMNISGVIGRVAAPMQSPEVAA
jgi:hypothetical protein